MVNGNYKSIADLMWKILKNPLASDLVYDECAEYVVEYIRLLGAPMAYEQKIFFGELSDYKLAIPCDIIRLDGVRINNCNSQKAMRESTNIYHVDPNEHNNNKSSEFTYKLQKGILFASIKEGTVEIAYKGLQLDDKGYPLIPDNPAVMLAAEYYVLSRYLEPLWLMGKITDKAFEYIQQKRYFYVPSSFNSLQMPNEDNMESIMNSINRIILDTNSHKNFFKQMGEKEQIKRFH